MDAFQYLTVDDNGRDRTVDACYFKPLPPHLIGDDKDDLSELKEMFEGVKDSEGNQPFKDVFRFQEIDIYKEWEQVAKGQNLNWSGIPLAILKFKELIKDAEEFKLLAGVPTHGNELLDKILRLESQFKAMQQSLDEVKKIARYLSSVDLTGKNVT